MNGKRNLELSQVWESAYSTDSLSSSGAKQIVDQSPLLGAGLCLLHLPIAEQGADCGKPIYGLCEVGGLVGGPRSRRGPRCLSGKGSILPATWAVEASVSDHRPHGFERTARTKAREQAEPRPPRSAGIISCLAFSMAESPPPPRAGELTWSGSLLSHRLQRCRERRRRTRLAGDVILDLAVRQLFPGRDRPLLAFFRPIRRHSRRRPTLLFFASLRPSSLSRRRGSFSPLVCLVNSRWGGRRTYEPPGPLLEAMRAEKKKKKTFFLSFFSGLGKKRSGRAAGTGRRCGRYKCVAGGVFFPPATCSIYPAATQGT